MKNCNNCHWYEKYIGVCFNGDSEWCADYPPTEEGCKCWEEENVYERAGTETDQKV